jgi:hypothetical protein
MTTTRGVLAGAAILVAGCAGHDDSDVMAVTTSGSEETVTPVQKGPTAGLLDPSADAMAPEPTGVFVTVESCALQTGSTCTGGYWLRELNGSQGPRLVSTLDVSRLAAAAIQQADGGGQALVYQGQFDAAEALTVAGAFVAFDVWRGLPDVVPPATDPVVAISTVALSTVDGALFASPLNEASELPIASVSVSDLAPPLVDTGWLASRVLDHGALVAGTLQGATFEASQVYVRLPDFVGPCRNGPPDSCGNREVPTYTRDDNRCLVPADCVTPRACPLYRPVCDPGYVLAAWPSLPGGCPTFACDAAFLGQ